MKRKMRRSERVCGHSFQPFGISSPGLKPQTTVERDYILSVRTRLQFLNPADVDDDRAVDPQEDFGIERSLQRVHRNMEQVISAPGMQLHIVFGGFHPIHVFEIDEHGLTG